MPTDAFLQNLGIAENWKIMIKKCKEIRTARGVYENLSSVTSQLHARSSEHAATRTVVLAFKSILSKVNLMFY